MIFYAHTLEGQPKESWEPLFIPFKEANTTASATQAGTTLITLNHYKIRKA